MNSRIGFGAFACASVLLCGTNVVFAQESAPPNQPVKTAEPGTGPQVNGQSVTERTQPDSPVDRFGAAKTLAISSDAALSITNTSLSGVDGSTTTISLAPALDYFVIQNLSVGGQISFAYVSPPGDGHTRSGRRRLRVDQHIPMRATVGMHDTEVPVVREDRERNVAPFFELLGAHGAVS